MKKRWSKLGQMLVLAFALVLLAAWSLSRSPQKPAPEAVAKTAPPSPPSNASAAAEGESGVELPPPLVSADPPESGPETVSLVASDKRVDEFPESVNVRVGDEEYTLTYTGMFTRSRNVVFVPVSLYSIASYIEKPEEVNSKALLDRLLQDGPRKVYILRFLKPLPGKQILTAIREEIDATFHDVDMKRLEENINEFVQIFSEGSSNGDEVYMSWLPDGRLYCSFKKKDSLQLIAQDVPLARAIWRIWAGEQTGEERLSLVERFTERK